METAPASSGTYPVFPAHAQGRLDVGDGHSIYWEVRGNPGGKPAVVLHGGPGSGASAGWSDVFDPAAYRVVLFDQRGCGRSTPNAAHTVDALKANTTQHLIADIEALRVHLGVDRWLVMGASWGSVLALAYGQAHPGSVSELVLFSVVGGTNREVEWATRGMGWFFPEEWRRFQAGVPETERDGDLSVAYYRLLLNPDPAVHGAAALNWCEWDDRQMRVPGEPPSPRYEDPAFRLCFARLVTHYWSHGHFVMDRALSTNAARLAGIPGILIRGALDLGLSADLLWRLARDWPESQLVVIDDEGHRGGPATNAALVNATDTFAKLEHDRGKQHDGVPPAA
ncbi:MAG: prolyl aminopeptidase [Solirubrobacteraceae bacterium]